MKKKLRRVHLPPILVMFYSFAKINNIVPGILLSHLMFVLFQIEGRSVNICEHRGQSSIRIIPNSGTIYDIINKLLAPNLTVP